MDIASNNTFVEVHSCATNTNIPSANCNLWEAGNKTCNLYSFLFSFFKLVIPSNLTVYTFVEVHNCAACTQIPSANRNLQEAGNKTWSLYLFFLLLLVIPSDFSQVSFLCFRITGRSRKLLMYWMNTSGPRNKMLYTQGWLKFVLCKTSLWSFFCVCHCVWVAICHKWTRH